MIDQSFKKIKKMAVLILKNGIAATCQKSWVGYALRKRATQACLMSVYFRKKDRQTDRQTDGQTDAINPAWRSP